MTVKMKQIDNVTPEQFDQLLDKLGKRMHDRKIKPAHLSGFSYDTDDVINDFTVIRRIKKEAKESAG